MWGENGKWRKEKVRIRSEEKELLMVVIMDEWMNGQMDR